MIRTVSALILVVALLSACSSENSGNAGQGEGAERQTPIAAVEIHPRDLSRQVSLSATVAPRTRIRLATRVSGRVEAVAVEEGDAVSAGQLLAQLDVSEELAELERARAGVEEAELEYERTAQLLERGDVTEVEYQRARTQLRRARSEVLLWETRRDFGSIRAPRDAVVAARHVEVGEAVSGQDALFELVDLSELVMNLGVSELDVVHLQIGQSVPVRLDAMPGKTLDGEIRRIFPTAETGSRLVTVEVALPADAARRGVRPGFLGRVRMAIDERPDVLAVPASAVGEDGDQRYVYVVRDDRLQRREVRTGVSRGNWTEVEEGLQEGDIVLATNPIDMRDGQAVRIVGWRG
ncbi:efflux RND transporter periplasmic adaptor subunit [Natronospira bacteriovora]|uniref:Efflux RND transporter periplasmic adaptor subunit n=1 Tax=Natronospira bacteriovora TaxID=3069753 RepID=A0ABU0W6Z5_9GAMM|nr:efflux RND transporter periplasmic adaptor subunit [Natronospira sp. AB-CW4]MDQ2069781.1 efflux RND transporter periplasmic adaptor subunit [Natronospira sp. AB-CW4]